MIGEQRCITLRAEQHRLGAILTDAMCLSKEGGEKDKKTRSSADANKPVRRV